MSGDRALHGLIRALRGSDLHETDWTSVLALANRTNITPYMAVQLRQRPDLPAEAANFLQVIGARTSERNARLYRQAKEALATLDGEGIQPILLKGSAFLVRAGPSLADRLFIDLDLMVPFDHADQAVGALEAIGYRLGPSSADRWYGVNLVRETDVGGIDLHYRLKTPYPHFAYADLAARCTQIAVGGARALLPSPELQVALLVLHDQLQEKDYWRGLIDLRHLIDIMAIIDREDGFDWGSLAALFPSGYPRRALQTQLLTLERLWDMQIPGEMGSAPLARLQLRRRLLQIRYKRLASFLTALSLLLDPPMRLGKSASAAPGAGGPWSRIAQDFRVAYKRHFRPPRANKV